jgi:hypothetical protein
MFPKLDEIVENKAKFHLRLKVMHGFQLADFQEPRLLSGIMRRSPPPNFSQTKQKKKDPKHYVVVSHIGFRTNT